MCSAYMLVSCSSLFIYSILFNYHLSFVLMVMVDTARVKCYNNENGIGPLNWKELSETQGISMVHLNARSLVNHFDEIKFLLSVYPQKLVLISETWLTLSHPDYL